MHVATPGYVGLHDRIDDLTHQYFPRMNLGQTRLGVLHKQSFTFVPGPAKPTKEGEPGASAYEKPMKPEKEEGKEEGGRDPSSKGPTKAEEALHEAQEGREEGSRHN